MSIKDKLESKLFNGYVMEPIPLVCLVIVIGLLMTGFVTWATLDYWHEMNAEIRMEICIIKSYHHEGTTYVLEADNGMQYVLSDKILENTEVLDTIISNHSNVIVKYRYPTNRHRSKYSIASLASEENDPIISESRIAEVDRQNALRSFLVIWGVVVCFWFFSIGSYIILCNAPKHPILAALLIRKAYRNF